MADFSGLRKVIEIIENQSNPAVPNKGIPFILQQFTKFEIAQRFLKYVSGKEHIDNTD